MTCSTLFSRAWAMPSPNTFSIPPIQDFLRPYLSASTSSCDPFARNSNLATHTNDLNPATSASHHMEAVAFLDLLAAQNVRCDLALLDPPYSPRQISECYRQAGLKCGRQKTQNSRLLKLVREALLPILTPDAIVLSFGWNSVGMGKSWRLLELLLVCHGGAHNDTICLAQRRHQPQPLLKP